MLALSDDARLRQATIALNGAALTAMAAISIALWVWLCCAAHAAIALIQG